MQELFECLFYFIHTPSAFWVIEFIVAERWRQEKTGLSEQSKTLVTLIHVLLIKTRFWMESLNVGH